MAKANRKDGEDYGKTVQLIIFRLGREEFGVPIEQVKEVTATPDIARMPRTPVFLRGVASIRGDIIAIMDLEARFKIGQMTDEEIRQSYTLVLEGEGYTMGMVVREVPQSLIVAESSIEKTPSILQDSTISEAFINGIAKHQGRLIIVLNAAQILSLEEADQLKTTTAN